MALRDLNCKRQGGLFMPEWLLFLAPCSPVPEAAYVGPRVAKELKRGRCTKQAIM